MKRGFYRIPDPVWDKYIAEESLADGPVPRDLRQPVSAHTVSPEWRTTTVMQLAHGIYSTRDYSDLPILADALKTRAAIATTSSITSATRRRPTFAVAGHSTSCSAGKDSILRAANLLP
ncbi:MAG: hypothetical protein U0792_22350 [Gemmataceae bacterium]